MKNGDFDPYVDEINRLSKRVAELEAALRDALANWWPSYEREFGGMGPPFDDYGRTHERAEALLAEKEGP